MVLKEIDPYANAKKIAWFIGVGIIGIIIFFMTFYTVNAGERAILITMGNPSDTVLSEGLHFKLPFFQTVYKFDIKTQTASFDNKAGTGDNSEYSSLFSASKDLQDVQIAVVVNYHIDESKVVYIYKNYGNQQYYDRNIVEPIIREAVKSIASKYTAEELVTQRQVFAAEVDKFLQTKLPEKHAIMERSSIVNLQFSDSFSKAIEAKVTAEQDALAAKNRLEQIKYEAQQNVEKAKGDAEAMSIVQKQLSASPTYIEYLAVQNQRIAIDKWDTHLPQVTGGSIPMISLSNMTR